MNIQNIIFDLGGVIINIDYQLTINAFKQLGISNFDEVFSKAKQEKLFDDLEKGNVSPDHFVYRLLSKMPENTTEQQVIDAWNAMLLNVPQERLSLLKKLNMKYNTSLLSNTNEIHLEAFHKKIKQENGISILAPFFDNVYFSCEMGMRKPDEEIFREVCDQENYKPEETLFIDDSIQHIEGARKVGLHAYHLKDKKITDLFDAHYNIKKEVL